MSAADVALIVARLGSQGAHAHDADPDQPVYPYVVVYANGGIRSSDREADVRIQRATDWQTTVVGETPAQCRLLLDHVTDLLEDWQPTSAQRSYSKVSHDGSQPVRKDDELPDRVLFIATDQWQVVSDPV